MAAGADWRSSLTATERYDNIERLSKALGAKGLGRNAFTIENEAYKNSNSREEYDAACEPPTDDDESDSAAEDAEESRPRVTIGNYQDCRYVASGVTSEVYRSEARALKVITEAPNKIEPHNPEREAKILDSLRGGPGIVELLETFRDRDQRLVLVFPYMPMTLAHVLDRAFSPLPNALLRIVFTSLFRALDHLHAQGIIHRDVKPSALLLSSRPSRSNNKPRGDLRVYLSDFGTAWHPTHSAGHERASSKVLDVGTGPYRAPEALFGHRGYGPAVDLWAAGAMLAESCARPRPRPLFHSPPAHEDGNQLGLIMNIFRTLGSPTPDTWPEALNFRTPPFEIYRVFDGKGGWDKLLPGVAEEWRELVAALVKYESGERVSAKEVSTDCTLTLQRMQLERRSCRNANLVPSGLEFLRV